MKRSEYIKIGIGLLAIALIFGVLPALATMLRGSSTESTGMDSTQQATDVGGALSFLGIMTPVALLGVVMIILGIRKGDNDG